LLRFIVIIKGEPGEEGNRGPPGKQGAEGEPGLYIPELDEIIAGNIGIQGELGQYENMCVTLFHENILGSFLPRTFIYVKD
jgi:hypothetical protein